MCWPKIRDNECRETGGNGINMQCGPWQVQNAEICLIKCFSLLFFFRADGPLKIKEQRENPVSEKKKPPNFKSKLSEGLRSQPKGEGKTVTSKSELSIAQLPTRRRH